MATFGLLKGKFVSKNFFEFSLTFHRRWRNDSAECRNGTTDRVRIRYRERNGGIAEQKIDKLQRRSRRKVVAFPFQTTPKNVRFDRREKSRT